MPVPFTRQVKQGVASPQFSPTLFGLEFPSAVSDKRKAEFSQHTSLVPFEIIIRRVIRAWVGLMWIDFLPTCVGNVERLLKQLVVQWQSMGTAFRMSHIKLW